MNKPIKNDANRQSQPMNTNFEEIFYQSPIGIFSYDKKGRLTNANDSALNIARIPKLSDILDTNIFDNPKIASKKEELHEKGLIKFQDTLNFIKINEQNIYNPSEKKIIDIDWTVSVIDSGYLIQIQDITDNKKAIETLQECEATYLGLFDSLDVAIQVCELIFDDEGHPVDNIILNVNPAYEKQTGLKKDEVIGKPINEILPVIEQLWLDRYGEVVHEGKSMHFEEYNANLDKWFDVHASPLGYNRFAAVFTDITESRKAEEALTESKDFAENLIETANVIVLGLDPEGKVTIFNSAAEKITGYSKEEVLGNSYETILPRERYGYAWEEFERLMHGALPKIYENPILTKSGKERHITWQNNGIYKDGQIVGTISFGIDITKRKKAEEELFMSEEKYRTLFEEDPDYNLLLGVDGTILEINKAAINLIGKSKKELIGKNYSILKITPTEDEELHLENINRILKGEYVKPFESRFIDKTGKIHWILLHLTAVKNENISYILAIGTDITTRKLVEKEIATSLKEKENLLKEIHHRVKNNMQIISSLLNLQTKYVDEKETVDVLKESQNRVKSMAMIHEKIYLSKDLTHINFVDYIQSLVTNLFYSYNIEKNQIKQVLEIDNVDLNMETAVPCGLIITELVSNSLKYAFPNEMKGKIFVSLKSKGDKYELIVKDNGIGLPEELDFNNLESLGLLLVKNLTEQIEGHINFNFSHGTEFKIIFKELKYIERI